MNSSLKKQIRDLNTKSSESELTPLVEAPETTSVPTPRICRIPTKARAEPPGGEESRRQQQITEESGETSANSRQPIPKEPSHENNIIKIGMLEESLPRFGPLYSIDQPSVDATKNKAWEHVLRKSSGPDASEDQQQVIKEIYLKAIRKIEKEAKDTYADKKVSLGIGSNFRWMMIKDGCFFLQLALLILGCSEQLGYPPNDPIFGRSPKRKDVNKWIESMFYVGNQMPIVVLRELMNQEFFQGVLGRRKWDNPAPSGLCKKVLYESLVLPALRKERFMGRGGDNPQDQPYSDLLHAVRNQVMGSAPLDRPYDQADDQIHDLEAGNEEEIGEYQEIRTSPGRGIIDDRLRSFLKAMGFPNAVEDRERVFPCATELRRAGIRIRKLKKGGLRSIHFKSYYLWAFLYLPVFLVDDNTELIFRNLKAYDNLQQFGRGRREAVVGSYLRVMSDIIQTTKDAKLLQKKGIIEGNSDDDVDKLPETLSRLSSQSQDIRLTQELRSLRRQMRDYSSPWIHYKGVINLVVFLTLVQTLFAMLAYFRPPKP